MTYNMTKEMEKKEYIAPRNKYTEVDMSSLIAISSGEGEGNHDANVRGWYGLDEDDEEYEEDGWYTPRHI